MKDETTELTLAEKSTAARAIDSIQPRLWPFTRTFLWLAAVGAYTGLLFLPKVERHSYMFSVFVFVLAIALFDTHIHYASIIKKLILAHDIDLQINEADARRIRKRRLILTTFAILFGLTIMIFDK